MSRKSGFVRAMQDSEARGYSQGYRNAIAQANAVAEQTTIALMHTFGATEVTVGGESMQAVIERYRLATQVDAEAQEITFTLIDVGEPDDEGEGDDDA